MSRSAAALLGVVLLCACDDAGKMPFRSRSEAVSSSSREMSGPSLFSDDALQPALAAMRSKARGRALRLEIRSTELVLQAEDLDNPGTVLEYHYRDGKLAPPEHATLRGKGDLKDNLFDLDQVRLDSLPELLAEAVRRVDPEEGAVEYVLLRRNLPDSEDVRFRVYVASPRRSGQLDADALARPL